MKLQSVKTEKEINLDGIKAEIEFRDSNVHSVTLRDASGNMVQIGKQDWSSIGIFIPAPPKMEKRYGLCGKLLGLADFSEVFEHEFQATERLNQIQRDNNYPENIGLEIKEVEVVVE